MESLSLLILTAARQDSAEMGWKRKFAGGLLAGIGFMLSPLTWWNDLFVNLPLATAFAWVISLFYQSAFEVSVIVGYWLTNILGLILLHRGAQGMLSRKEAKYSRRDLLRDIGISLLYTALIVLLLKVGILKPLKNYFAVNPGS